MSRCYKNYKKHIRRMYQLDQRMRQWYLHWRSEWDDSVDQKNTICIKQMIHTVGSSFFSKIWKRYLYQAWILIQHADHDIDFQIECLKIMKQSQTNDVLRYCIQFLSDRILVHVYWFQLYGTQYRMVQEEKIPFPLTSDETLLKQILEGEYEVG